VLLNSVVADLTDLDELRTGKRREGSYASVIGFITKLATTGATLIIGLVFDYLIRFDASLGANQTPETWQRMRLYTMAIPCVFSVLALLVIAKFPLTKQRMQEVRALLDARAAAQPADAPAPTPPGGETDSVASDETKERRDPS
jgi:GPH family glycoside/pentoside/hexuronide:cation symporter